ncbi:MAG: glycoside hydrolase family 6 protein [Streptosporangiaceae bacterium]
MRRPRRVSRPALAAVIAVAVAAAVSVASVVALGATSSAAPSLFAYPANPLYAPAAALESGGDHALAAELKAITQTPSGIWAAGQPDDIAMVRTVTLAAGQAHAVPVIVAYNLPDRDACGKLSGRSGPTAAGYQEWINQLAAAIGTSHDIVIVEPDGLPDIVRGCLSPALAAQRDQLLRYAMKELGRLPHARVYLDAGNPGMFADPAQLAAPLEAAGLRDGRGFSANVSNFQWTAGVVTWSQHLERALGGTVGAVIDTSRNGRGPYTGPAAPQWCNPPGRAVGPAPKLNPGPAGIDAYLWIKDPGASDGACGGGPAAGQYWPRYAAALTQLAPPAED